MSKSFIESLPVEEVKKLAQESLSMREFQIKLGYSPNSNVSNIINKYCLINNISLNHFTYSQPGAKRIKRTPLNTFIQNSTTAQKTLRKLYKEGNYTEYKCSICGLDPFWNGKELTLTLDHINGDNRDDRLENLRWVCPNCDRQLDTFCSKNMNYDIRKQKKQIFYCENCGKEISSGAKLCFTCYAFSLRQQERPQKEELKNILQKYNGNFTKVGQLFDVSDNTIRKWCKSYNLPFHSSDYKNI